MEERKPNQDPEAEDFATGEIQQRTRTSTKNTEQSEVERRLIEEGQARAVRDEEELNRRGFGGQIGSE